MEHWRGGQLEKEGHKACMQKEACDHIYIYIYIYIKENDGQENVF